MAQREPWKYTTEEIAEILQVETFDPPIPSLTDTESWRACVGTPCADMVFDGTDAMLELPIPQSRATEYLAFWQSGDRAGFEVNYSARRDHLARLWITYCVTHDERRLCAITDYVWAICEESSWLMSAHLRNNGSASELPSARIHQIDLGAAQTGLLLAEVIASLSPVLHPDLVRRVEEELELRILQPFRYRNNFHWQIAEHNWNAVCHCGVLGTAIYAVRDPRELAAFLMLGLRGLACYLSGFDEDGGVSEGLLPWSFGFAHYCILSDLLERRTGGRLSLISGVPNTREIARFPIKLHFSGTRYVTFSDADESFELTPLIYHYLSTRHAMDLPIQPFRGFRNFNFTVRLFLMGAYQHTAEYPVHARTDYFRGLMWMISRVRPDDPDTLILAAKGGHNQEHHNHNDCGAFIVYYRGESLIAELGRDTFRRQMFDAGRYEILANRSEGHSIPVVNGYGQSYGRRFAARFCDHTADADSDLLQIDIAPCYPDEAGISSLTRTFRLDRADRGQVTVQDIASFATAGRLEEVFWTFLEPEYHGGTLTIAGTRGSIGMTFSSDGVPVEPNIERVNAAVRGTDAYRIAFLIPDAESVRFEVRIFPTR